MNRYAIPCSAWSTRSSSTMLVCTDTSRADRISSQSISRGFAASARAIATRCRSPPESWSGIAARKRGVEPHVLERLRHPGAAGLAVQPEEELEWPPDDLVHALPRIERGVRVLEHELDLATDVLRPRLDGGGEDAALERDLSGERPQQPADGACDRRLAAAGFADERERLARSEVERDVADDHQGLARHGPESAAPVVCDREVSDVEQRIACSRRERDVARSRDAPGGESLDVVDTAARHFVRLADGKQDLALLEARLLGEVAARREAAALRQLAALEQSTQDDLSAAVRLRDRRHGGDQTAGVWVTGVGEELAHRRVLDELAGIHHADAVADRRDDAEVVRDVDHRHAELGAQPTQQVEDLRLRRHVETGRRLVEDDELRIAGERHRDHHALLLPARELVRILAAWSALRRAGGRARSARGRAAGARHASRRRRAPTLPRRAGRRCAIRATARSSGSAGRG